MIWNIFDCRSQNPHVFSVYQIIGLLLRLVRDLVHEENRHNEKSFDACPIFGVELQHFENLFVVPTVWAEQQFRPDSHPFFVQAVLD